jgi:hypothetical protein
MRRLSLATTISLGLLAACGDGPPRAPAAPSAVQDPGRGVVGPQAPGATSTITVTDGWSGSPVGGASVGNDRHGTVITGADGRAAFADPPSGCDTVVVRATGYLVRETCFAGDITLWPVASDAEVTATQEFAFAFGRTPALYPLPFTRVGDLAGSAETKAVWVSAIAEVAAATDGQLNIPFDVPETTDDSFLISIASTPPTCDHSWFKWRYDVAGFCWDSTPDYFVLDVTIDPQRLSDVATATRALLYGHGFRPHSMPGLMNRTNPTSTLSEFERKTLHMMALRWPGQSIWPDKTQR